MYGKVMSVPDKAMPLFMRMVTRWGASEIAALEKQIADGKLHPRDAKMKIAREITAVYYDEAQAEEAEQEFVKVFQEGDAPEEMASYKLADGQTVLDVLVAAELASSKSEARRLIDQKGVRLDGKTLEDANAAFPGAGVLQVGKRKFVRVVK
jgi:tyrosyl-tRNA synthetase